jgi:hypothetical protein
MADTPTHSLSDFLYEGETEEDLALYSAMGRVVVLWGRLEYHFGCAVMILHDLHGGRALTKEPPFKISKKLEFWKDCFKSLPDLQKHHETASSFAGEMKKASKNRDDLLHFSWGAPDNPGGPGTVRGQSIKATAKGHEDGELILPVRALLDFAEHIEKLQMRMMGFTLLIGGAKSKR